MTADELLQLPEDGWKYELVSGELRKMSPPGYRHGRLALRLGHLLLNFVEARQLGDCVTDAGFRLSRTPDTVRAPDVAFVRAERASSTARFFEGAPDIAFEVVSPNDSYSDIKEKTADYLRAGAQAVVVIDPQTKSVEIHRPNGSTNVADVITIPDVLPGWQLPLSELFD